MLSGFPTDPIPTAQSAVVQFQGDPDRATLSAALSGKRWTTVDFSYLRSKYPGPLSEAFTYLSTIGKLYYVPAFIGMCEQHPELVDDLPDAIAFSITEQSSDRDEFVKTLTPLQKKLIVSFFEKALASASPTYAAQIERVRIALK